MALSLPLALGHHSPPKPSVSIGTLIRGGVDEDGHDRVSELKTLPSCMLILRRKSSYECIQTMGS